MTKTFVKTFYSLLDAAYVLKLKYQYRYQIKNKANTRIKKLNSAQKKEIKLFFSKYGRKNVNLSWHEFFSFSNKKFSVEYIPEDIFHAVISRKLNRMKQWPALLDKNLLYTIFNDYKQPEAVIKNINGFFFIDKNMISKNQAIEFLINQKGRLLIKPSIESGNGQNILPFDLNSTEVSKRKEFIETIFKKYSKNFIIQKVINQNAVLMSLNPDSLNTLRVMSYLNDNGVHILSSIIRIGRKGSFTDNFESGGLGCGIDQFGYLHETGYYDNGDSSMYTDIGIALKGKQIPCFEDVLAQVKKMHLKIPYFRLVSWDIGIDIDNSPILIEYNTYHQGICVHQLANGPLFGSFTDEILKEGLS